MEIFGVWFLIGFSGWSRRVRFTSTTPSIEGTRLIKRIAHTLRSSGLYSTNWKSRATATCRLQQLFALGGSRSAIQQQVWRSSKTKELSIWSRRCSAARSTASCRTMHAAPSHTSSQRTSKSPWAYCSLNFSCSPEISFLADSCHRTEGTMLPGD